MTDIEQWEPDSEDAALDRIDRARALLQEANSIEDVVTMRDQAEMVRIWAARRDRSKAIELEAQDFIRRAERKLAELLLELKEAGMVRGPGRPKKSVDVSEEPDSGSRVSDEQPDSGSRVSTSELFVDARERTAANLFASVDEDTWNEALDDARAAGDLSRKALVRALKGASTRAEQNGETEFTPIARVMVAVLKNLAAVVERLKEFDPTTVESDQRKEWNNAIREAVGEIETWRKALPR